MVPGPPCWSHPAKGPVTATAALTGEQQAGSGGARAGVNLSSYDVIEALDHSVQVMDVGEMVMVTADSKWSLGLQGLRHHLHNRSPQSGPVPRDNPEDSIVKPDPEMLTEQRVALANWKKRSDVNYLQANLVLAANSYDPTIKAITSSAKVDVTFEEEEQLLQLGVKRMNKLAAWHLRVVSKPERSNRTVNRESSRLRKKHMDQQSSETALCWKMLPPPQPSAQ